MFTTGDDVPLVKVLESLYAVEKGKASLDPKESEDKLFAKLGEALPEHDRERIYASDVRKLFAWYDQLLKAGDFTAKAQAEEKAEKEEEKAGKTKATKEAGVRSPRPTRRRNQPLHQNPVPAPRRRAPPCARVHSAGPDPDMGTVAPALRTYLPAALAISGWPDVAPFFIELQERKVHDAASLEKWLRDLSELEAVISEEGAWRYIRVTLDTRDAQASERYQTFVTEVLPSVEQETDKLQRKLMALPQVNELHGEGYPVLLRGIREQLRIFREANVAIQAELRSMAQEYSAVDRCHERELERLRSMPKAAAILESPDRSERHAIYDLVATRRAQDSGKLAELFHAMVAKRDTMATNAGFVNFRNYMYSALGQFE